MVGANVKGSDGNFINGEIVKVSGFDAKGRIIVEDGRTLDARILSYGYASTSHKSQGSTCDAVILGIDARSAANFADMKLAYVGATRGRESIDVYCEDKSLLYEIGLRTGDRELALEGMGGAARKLCEGLLALAERLSKAVPSIGQFKTLKDAAIRQAFFRGNPTPNVQQAKNDWPVFRPTPTPSITTTHQRRGI